MKKRLACANPCAPELLAAGDECVAFGFITSIQEANGCRYAADGDNFGIIEGSRVDLSSYLIGARHGKSESDRASG